VAAAVAGVAKAAVVVLAVSAANNRY